ncbi:MCE family protein [Actinomadura craniellae]|uniref:MCE family protein n=1 Tax=Actinomadura craniellae TaxID=2231787 RepID=A0A365H7T1_9ACTN|nr:MCE family protein [Actinomadura craniellae]RAY15170.1 MCE family protein [Actinomadura craniellae]
MKTTTAAIKLTVFVLVTSLLTGILAITIANTRFIDSRRYKAIFTDVAGLLVKDDVRVAGVRVGQIEEIRLHGGRQAEVTFSLQKQGVFATGLPRSTRAQLRYRNLIGQRYLALEEGPGAVDDHLPPGGTIPVGQTRPALDLTVLFNGFRPLFRALEPDDVNKLAFQIVQTLQGEGGTVNSLLAHVASLTNTLADRDQVIGRVIENLNTVLGTIDRRHTQVDLLIRQLRSFVSGVSADRAAIFDSLDAINQLTGVTADLVKDVRPSVRTDIAGLNRLTRTLADERTTLDKALERTPDRLDKLVHASSYGSWFNFYLCGLDARIVLPDGPVMQTPSIINENARCKPQ